MILFSIFSDSAQTKKYVVAVPPFKIHPFVSTMKFVTADDQCRTEVNIEGMALGSSVFKRCSLAAPHLCDVKCRQEITCQSYNYNRKYQICELNNRTKEARPENFLSAPAWFYIRRLNGRGKKSNVSLCDFYFS